MMVSTDLPDGLAVTFTLDCQVYVLEIFWKVILRSHFRSKGNKPGCTVKVGRVASVIDSLSIESLISTPFLFSWTSPFKSMTRASLGKFLVRSTVLNVRITAPTNPACAPVPKVLMDGMRMWYRIARCRIEGSIIQEVIRRGNDGRWKWLVRDLHRRISARNEDHVLVGDANVKRCTMRWCDQRHLWWSLFMWWFVVSTKEWSRLFQSLSEWWMNIAIKERLSPCLGADHGIYACDQRCKCRKNWSGDDCSCTAKNETCLGNNVSRSTICNNKGDCECDRCTCHRDRENLSLLRVKIGRSVNRSISLFDDLHLRLMGFIIDVRVGVSLETIVLPIPPSENQFLASRSVCLIVSTCEHRCVTTNDCALCKVFRNHSSAEPHRTRCPFSSLSIRWWARSMPILLHFSHGQRSTRLTRSKNDKYRFRLLAIVRNEFWFFEKVVDVCCRFFPRSFSSPAH